MLAPAAGHRTLVSTDLLCEGIHFDLTYSPLKHLGYKAVVVNLSDICAMNGTPPPDRGRPRPVQPVQRGGR